MNIIELESRLMATPVFGSLTDDSRKVTFHHFEDEWWMLFNDPRPNQQELGLSFPDLGALLRFCENKNRAAERFILLREGSPSLDALSRGQFRPGDMTETEI